MKITSAKKQIQNLAYASLCLALGIALPFLTGQIPQIGSMLLPMHLPVLVCGLICGWKYGVVVGFIMPLLRFALFSMPPIFPTGISMAFELAAYGGIAGYLYSRSPWQCVIAVYRALITAMIGGRIIWGVVRVLLTGVAGEAFTWQLFLAGAFLNAIPGIILQLIFIPALMLALHRAHLLPFHQGRENISTQVVK